LSPETCRADLKRLINEKLLHLVRCLYIFNTVIFKSPAISLVPCLKYTRSFRNPPHTHKAEILLTWSVGIYSYQTAINPKLCSSNYTEAECHLLQLKILFMLYILVKAKISRQIYILCSPPETKVTMATIHGEGFLYVLIAH